MKRRQTRRLFPLGGVLAIDPGSSSGCIAYVVSAKQAWVWPIKNMTLPEIYHRIQKLSLIARIGVLERVGAMPKQGVASSFKFGASFGGLQMALVACGIRYELVAPSVWQKALKCQSGGDKKITREAAQRLFPGVLVIHDTADALLIGEYGRKFL